MEFTFTENELKAAKILLDSILNNMGGNRPSDLEGDPFTWVDIRDLTSKGYSRHEATGTFGSLIDKGFINQYDVDQWCVTEAGWKYMDTIWDN